MHIFYKHTDTQILIQTKNENMKRRVVSTQPLPTHPQQTNTKRQHPVTLIWSQMWDIIHQSICRFKSLICRIKSINRCIKSINHRIKSINHRIKSINQRIKSINHRIKSINHRIKLSFCIVNQSICCFSP